MARTPRRTALDARLSFQARLADDSAPLGRPPVAAFATRAMVAGSHAPGDVEPTREGIEAATERATVKLLVEQRAYEEAARWVEAHGGALIEEPESSATSEVAFAVLLATLPLAALSEADAQPWIARVEASRVLLPRLEGARGEASGLDAGLERHTGLTGAGVVIGVIDTGVDWRHDDFRDDSGLTRIERFVHAHLVGETDESRFDIFDAKAINAALDGQDSVPAGDPQGHGTHCASIAAGSGRASGGRLRGVAPEAALLAVRSEPLLDTHTIEGIRATFELAGDRPAVVSLSLGGHLGPHDGTTALENEIARMSGPGRIVVVAAGNEGADQIHASGRLVEGEDLVIPFRVAGGDLQWVDVWIPRGDAVDLWVETPDGVRFEPDGEVNTTVFGLLQADFVEDRINRDQNLTAVVVQGRPNHRWAVRLRASKVVHGEVHAWSGTHDTSTSAALFPETHSPLYSVGMPATEPRAVVAGSFVSRNRFPSAHGELVAESLTVGGLSPFSSQGPTRYGGQKPDVVAPGQYITASLAAGSEMATGEQYAERHHPDGGYITIQGTSMSTPFVAGVIALLLQREPTLTPEEVQQRIRVTARRDAQTGQVWNPGFGFGKLDAAALLDYQAMLLP